MSGHWLSKIKFSWMFFSFKWSDRFPAVLACAYVVFIHAVLVCLELNRLTYIYVNCSNKGNTFSGDRKRNGILGLCAVLYAWSNYCTSVYATFVWCKCLWSCSVHVASDVQCVCVCVCACVRVCQCMSMGEVGGGEEYGVKEGECECNMFVWQPSKGYTCTQKSERERECVCVCVCVCVCERERERESVHACVHVCVGKRECVCLCVCECACVRVCMRMLEQTFNWNDTTHFLFSVYPKTNDAVIK